VHPNRHEREDDILMLNITKQVVQMHSTATEVGTAVDGKSRLEKILIKVNFQHGWREASADEGKIRSCKGRRIK